MTPTIVSLAGQICTGKDTLAAGLEKALGFTHFSTGSYLRSLPDPKIQTALAAGDYLPDHLVQPEVMRQIHQHSKGGLVLNGYPRSAAQALMMDFICNEENRFNWHVIVLQASDNTVRARLAKRQQDGARTDDAKLDYRMKEFDEQMSLMAYVLGRKNIPLTRVDTDQRTPAEVLAAVQQALLTKATHL